MVRLNSVEYECVPGMSLKELVDTYNAGHPSKLNFDDFIVIVNSSAIAASQAPEKMIQENDNIFIVPIVDGG
jgi:sulfur carrier protein ThiS